MDIITNNIPDLLQIELTYSCNLNCPFCYNAKRESTNDIPKIDRLVNRIAEFDIPHVYLIGGEPTVLGVENLNKYIDKLSEKSSVVLVTNGYERMEHLSNKLAYIGVSLHGYNMKTHEQTNNVKGSYNRTLDNIRYYKSLGIRVRCVIVLTGINYKDIDKLIIRCILAGADEIFIDRYEEGGIGAKNSDKLSLKPSNRQFREALTKIINVRNMSLINKDNIAFGTAIPFCIDRRLFDEGLLSTCGAGLDFCAITPDGELRICNQSERSFGNIFEKDIDEIWNNRNLNLYRNYSWLSEPCKSCKLVNICQSGCRVDSSVYDDFCIDYALRDGIDDEIKENIQAINKGDLYYRNVLYDKNEYDLNNKYICISDYLKLNRYKNEIYMITRYQGVNIGEYEAEIIHYILEVGIFTIDDLYERFKNFERVTINYFINLLLNIGAVFIVDEDYIWEKKLKKLKRI